MRLVNHCEDGFWNRREGRVRAIPISGTPRKTGVMNWSKKLSAMVSFRVLF